MKRTALLVLLALGVGLALGAAKSRKFRYLDDRWNRTVKLTEIEVACIQSQFRAQEPVVLRGPPCRAGDRRRAAGKASPRDGPGGPPRWRGQTARPGRAGRRLRRCLQVLASAPVSAVARRGRMPGHHRPRSRREGPLPADSRREGQAGLPEPAALMRLRRRPGGTTVGAHRPQKGRCDVDPGPSCSQAPSVGPGDRPALLARQPRHARRDGLAVQCSICRGSSLPARAPR